VTQDGGGKPEGGAAGDEPLPPEAAAAPKAAEAPDAGAEPPKAAAAEPAIAEPKAVATPAPAAPPAADAPAQPSTAAPPANAATTAEPVKAAAKPAAAEPAKPAAAPAKAATAAAAKPAAAAAKPAAEPAKPAKPAEPKLPKAPPWYRALRAEPPAHLRLVLGLAMVVFLVGLWWIVTRGVAESRIISPSRLPSPGEVVDQIDTLRQRSLGDSIIDTLERVFKGVGLAALVGVGAGVIASAHRGVGAVLNPLVIFLRSVPMGALFPLTLLLFSEHRQKTMFLFLALVAFVFSDTVKAMMSVPERFVETAQTLGASRFQIIRKVLVPLALPDIVTSLRFQFGLALGYVMLAEEYNTRYGLGNLITTSQRLGQTEHVYLLLLLIAVLAFGIDLILRTLQRGIFTWRKDL
jgi:taurine transport system permease protein